MFRETNMFDQALSPNRKLHPRAAHREPGTGHRPLAFRGLVGPISPARVSWSPRSDLNPLGNGALGYQGIRRMILHKGPLKVS